jgi:sugar lactone lactonase YvrE
VAGGGNAGLGDGGPATSAQLGEPSGVAIDAAGNLFIADTYNQRIRKVTPGGVISTVAGNGIQGYSGDGGPATSAQLSYPSGLAIDTAGNLFIADWENNCVRKVTPTGVISTVAGGGNAGLGDGGPATSAQLATPMGVAVDAAGNLFIADTGNARVRKVTPGGVINTVAGIGPWPPWYYLGDGIPATSAQLSYPLGVAVDAAGNLFIADTDNNRVRKVIGGVINTIAGNGTFGYSGDGGPATSAQLYRPMGVAVDAAGNLFIADTYNNRVRKVTPAGIISTVAGTGDQGFYGDGGPATSAAFYEPTGVAVDTAGNLFIADWGNNCVRKVIPGGVISTVAGNEIQGYSGDGGPATSAQLYRPQGVAVDAAGNLFISDTYNNRVRKVTPGGIISTVAGNGTQGDSGDGGPATSAQLNGPQGVAVDAAGNLFIADTGTRMVTTAGVISTVASVSGFGVAVDSAGNLFIVGDGVHKVTPAGIISTVAGNGTVGYSGDGGPATSAQFYQPEGVAVDAAGNLFIADTFNNRVRRVAGGASITMDITLTTGGSATASTAGVNETTHVGYATLAVNSGAVPYGTAVFSVKQNGVTVSESGVPASPPTTAGRIFIDYRSSVAAIPSNINAGTVDIDTGIAVVNLGSAPANVTYTLRDIAGTTLSIGHGTLPGGEHFAKFIDQFGDVAPDFVLPENFQTATQFASLEISSDQPVSILALSMSINQRNESLYTTTPIADLTQPLTSDTIYFPQLADGGGDTTSIVLLNTSNGIETGTLQIFDDNGNPLVVNQVGGTSGSTFRYSISNGGAVRFQTDGSPTTTNVGWVQLIPDTGTSTPVGAGVFSYNPGNFLVTESGVPAAVSTTHARIYVDLSGGHNTGLAIANPKNAKANITITAFQSDGVTGIGTSQGPLLLSANGHGAHFVNEFITGLPAGFTGVLDISSPTPFAALTMRSLYNERNDFLVATFPIADMTREAPAPIVFPQIADGGGLMTQFILIGAGGTGNTTLSFYAEDGTPLAVGK